MVAKVQRKQKPKWRMEMPKMTPSQQLAFLVMKEKQKEEEARKYNESRQYAYACKENQ